MKKYILLLLLFPIFGFSQINYDTKTTVHTKGHTFKDSVSVEDTVNFRIPFKLITGAGINKVATSDLYGVMSWKNISMIDSLYVAWVCNAANITGWKVINDTLKIDSCILGTRIYVKNRIHDSIQSLKDSIINLNDTLDSWRPLLYSWKNDSTSLIHWSDTTNKISTKTDANNKWSKIGNAGTSYTTNFLGTTDAQGIHFRTNNIERGKIDSSLGYWHMPKGLKIGNYSETANGICLGIKRDSTNPVLGMYGLYSQTFPSFISPTIGNKTCIGITEFMTIDTDNNSNWDSVNANFRPNPVGISSVVQAMPGATGRIPKTACFYGTMISNGMTYSEANIIDITYDHTGTYTHANGIRIADIDAGVNGAGLYLVNGDTKYSPLGHWTLYDSLGYNSYFKGEIITGNPTDIGAYQMQVKGNSYISGALSINTTSVTDKLVINGNIDLQKAADWSYLKNSTSSGGLRLSTGNAIGTLTTGIEISSALNFIKLNHKVGIGVTTAPTELFQMKGGNAKIGVNKFTFADSNSVRTDSLGTYNSHIKKSYIDSLMLKTLSGPDTSVAIIKPNGKVSKLPKKEINGSTINSLTIAELTTTSSAHFDAGNVKFDVPVTFEDSITVKNDSIYFTKMTANNIAGFNSTKTLKSHPTKDLTSWLSIWTRFATRLLRIMNGNDSSNISISSAGLAVTSTQSINLNNNFYQRKTYEYIADNTNDTLYSIVLNGDSIYSSELSVNYFCNDGTNKQVINSIYQISVPVKAGVISNEANTVTSNKALMSGTCDVSIVTSYVKASGTLYIMTKYDSSLNPTEAQAKYTWNILSQFGNTSNLTLY